MTIETPLSCFLGHRTAQTIFERFRHRTRVNNSEVETLDLLIIADATFVKHALMSKHISLTCLTLAEAVEHGFGNRVQTITDCVDALLSVANNLIVVGTVAKVQARISL